MAESKALLKETIAEAKNDSCRKVWCREKQYSFRLAIILEIEINN